MKSIKPIAIYILFTTHKNANLTKRAAFNRTSHFAVCSVCNCIKSIKPPVRTHPPELPTGPRVIVDGAESRSGFYRTVFIRGIGGGRGGGALSVQNGPFPPSRGCCPQWSPGAGISGPKVESSRSLGVRPSTVVALPCTLIIRYYNNNNNIPCVCARRCVMAYAAMDDSR